MSDPLDEVESIVLLAQLSARLSTGELAKNEDLRKITVSATVAAFGGICNHGVAWKELYGNERYIKEAMQHVAEQKTNV